MISHLPNNCICNRQNVIKDSEFLKVAQRKASAGTWYEVGSATVSRRRSVWLLAPRLVQCLSVLTALPIWHLFPSVPQSLCCCTITVFSSPVKELDLTSFPFPFYFHQWTVLWVWIKSLVWLRQLLALPIKPKRACFALLDNSTKSLSPSWWPLSATPTLTLFAASSQIMRSGYVLISKTKTGLWNRSGSGYNDWSMKLSLAWLGWKTGPASGAGSAAL